MEKAEKLKQETLDSIVKKQRKTNRKKSQQVKDKRRYLF